MTNIDSNAISFLENPRFQRVVPWLLLLLALYFRFWRLTSTEIYLDEPFTIFWAQAPLLEYLKLLIHENNPPLHNLFVKAWTAIFGIGPLSVRFPSAIFSALTVPVIYKVTSRYWGVLAGLGAAILLLFSNYHQQFAHEARAYALLAFLASVSVYAFMKLCEGDGDKRTRWVYILSTAAMLYTHFFGMAVLLIELSVLAFSGPWRKRWSEVKRPLLITSLLFLPYVGLFVYRSFLSVSQGTWVRHLEDIKEVAYIVNMLTNKSSIIFVVLMTLL